MTRYLVCYDISDNARREKVANALLDYGCRVQESVFWLDIDDELAERMTKRVRKYVEEEDSLWVVPVCGACAGKMVAMGKQAVPRLPEFYVI